MSTIIDGLNKTTKQELTGLIACMESYTLKNAVGQTIKRIANIFRLITQKRISPAGLNVLYQSTADSLTGASHEALLIRVTNDIVKYGKHVGVRDGSDDAISVSMMRAVSSLFGKQHYTLMSPAEMADDLTVKCKSRDTNKIKRWPTIWGIFAILIFIIFLYLMIFISRKLPIYGFPQPFISKVRLVVVFLGLIGEIIWSLTAKNKLCLEKLAYVMAVGGTGYGKTFSVSMDETIISKMTQSDSQKYEEGLRALHTLTGQVNHISSQVKSLSEENEKLSLDIENGSRELEKLKLSLSSPDADPVFINEQIKEKENECERKKESILQRKDTISQAEDAIIHFDEQRKALRKTLVDQISKLWISSYPELNLHFGFFESMVDSCEWNAFEKIERRLIELLRAQDPKALGQNTRNDKLVIMFSTNKKSGQIFYTVDKKINITEVLRGLAVPDDIPLGEGDLHRILIDYGVIKVVNPPAPSENISAKEIINKLATNLKESQSKAIDLSNKNNQLVVEIETLNLEIASIEANKKELEDERDDLIRQIKEAKGEAAEQLKAREKELNEKISKLENDLNNKIGEIEKINEDYKKKSQELVQLLKQRHDKIDSLNSVISEKQTKIDDLSKENENLIHNNEELKSDVYLKQQLLEDRQKKLNSQIGKTTDLKKVKEKLTIELEKKKDKIKSQTQQIAQNKEKQQKLKKDISDLKTAKTKADEIITSLEKYISQLQQSNKKLEEDIKSSKVLHEKEIIDEFENAFKTANKEIDIAVPWLGRYASTEFPDLMENCLKRDVKIKIRYGLMDTKLDKDYSYGRLRKKIDNKEKDLTRFEWSVKNIMNLHERFDKKYPGKFISYRDRSHTKLMLIDKKYYIIGSLNLLSYRRDEPGWGELAEKSENSTMINSLYNTLFSFEETTPEEDLGI